MQFAPWTAVGNFHWRLSTDGTGGKMPDGATYPSRSCGTSRKSSRRGARRCLSAAGSPALVRTRSTSANGGSMIPRHYYSIFHSAFAVSEDLKFTMSEGDGWLNFTKQFHVHGSTSSLENITSSYLGDCLSSLLRLLWIFLQLYSLTNENIFSHRLLFSTNLVQFQTIDEFIRVMAVKAAISNRFQWWRWVYVSGETTVDDWRMFPSILT